MRLEDVLLKPLITEKSAKRQQLCNEYFFSINTKADKTKVRLAVEKFFKVKVISVQTVNVLGKTKRVGRSIAKMSPWKKAMVRLAPNHSIKIFEGK